MVYRSTEKKGELMLRSCTPVIVAFAFGLVLAAQVQADTAEEFHKTFPLDQGATVRVSNSSGKVEVSSWEKPYADVRAVKHSRNGREELERVSIEINATNNALDIQTVYDSSRNVSHKNESFLSRLFGEINSGSRAYVDYTIRIPRTSELESIRTSSGSIVVHDVHGDALLQSSSGDIAASGMDGSVKMGSSSGRIFATQCRLRHVHSSSGDIRLQDVGGDFRLESSSGGVNLSGSDGRIDAHSSSGDYTVTGARGPISIETSSGCIRVDNSVLSTIHSTSGDVLLRNVSGDMSIRTSSGTMQVSGSGGSVDAQSTSGSICLDGFVLRGATSSSGDIKVRATGLGNSVRLATNSGSITLDLPDKVNVDLVMETSSGELVNRCGQPITTTTVSRKRIIGKIGGGGTSLTMHTSSGNVELK